MKHRWMAFLILAIAYISLGSECHTKPPEKTCLDNTLAVIEALKDTYPLVIVEGDYCDDARHVECFYWEDGRWKCGYWTGAIVTERPQDWRFSASVYNYEEYEERVRMYGWR